jgi:hypothetical protein
LIGLYRNDVKTSHRHHSQWQQGHQASAEDGRRPEAQQAHEGSTRGESMDVQIQEVDGKPHAKVRIPVAINEKGEWWATSDWKNDRDGAHSDTAVYAAECGSGPVTVHFVYALVPLPGHSVIAGEVE